MARIKVLHVGVGPIGAGIVRQVVGRKWLKIVGAVDVDPDKVGRDLGEVAAVGRRVGVKVTSDVAKTIRAAKPDVAILCTQSSLRKALGEFEAVLALKVPIVSTTEELAYPVKRNAATARRIDALARKARVAVLGTGVNPGFVMDALPIALTSVCDRVDAIQIDRVQDARVRRLPFQQKIGAGLTPDAFESRVETGTVRHVGLAESISMIADAMGWKIDRITDEIGPKLAETRVSSAFITVEPGQVAGIVQDGVGYRDGKPVIRLHMEAYLGAPKSYDAVRIDGVPPIAMTITGGVHGDIATVAMVVNSIPKVLNAPPGLRTMRDMILPGFEGRA
ncbi:MAG: dihydrodipicolinate reductase [Acidobacteria bacterium]|nr:dihydrodipicolinate reductase [Acidobacteriota bacterium]